MNPSSQPRPRPTLVPSTPSRSAADPALGAPGEAFPTDPQAGPHRAAAPGDPHDTDPRYVAPVTAATAVEPRREAVLPTPPPRARLSEILRRIADDPALERVSIGDIVAAMPGRATAALLFLFAAPNAIPTPPGTSALLGLPMIYLASQMMLQRKPWLPKLVAERSIRMTEFVALVNRAVPLLTRAERMLRPRLAPLVSPAAEVAIGAFCLLLALSVALPIPLGNMLPALAVSILALGVLERDGLWVLIGGAVGAGSLVVVSGVVWAAIKISAAFFGYVFD